MKFIGFILALALFAGILFVLGYGLFEVWAYLGSQWSLIETAWKPLFILLSSEIVLCTLLVILAVKSSFNRSLNASQGKSSAYNQFMRWYLQADASDYSTLDADGLLSLRAEFLLWAGNNVLKQFNNLYSELVGESANLDHVRKYANSTYIEMQRELGRRAGARLRQI